MLVLGEINAMAGKRLPDLLRRFGCQGLARPAPDRPHSAQAKLSANVSACSSVAVRERTARLVITGVPSGVPREETVDLAWGGGELGLPIFGEIVAMRACMMKLRPS